MPNDPFVDVAALSSLGPIRYLDARDQAMFDAGHAPGAVRVPVDVSNLLVKISLYAPAYRRIELGQVADLHVLWC